MSVVSIRRWQWLAISLLVGMALWGLRQGNGTDLWDYGEGLNDPQAFEQALVSEIQGIPRFKDVSVRSATLDDGAGGRKAVHLVWGKFCNGRVDPADGKYHWRPRVFVASVPYRPRTHLWRPDDRGVPPASDAADRVARFERLPAPTVVDFLQLLHERRGVRYTHDWWASYPLAAWLGGSVLLIGVVWPTVINLLAFGRLTRPAEEKGIDLSQVHVASTRPAPPSPATTERLRELEAELEANLAAGAAPAVGPAAAASAETAAAPPPAALQCEQLAPAADVAAEHKVFTADPDDYYATEVTDHRSHHHGDARSAG